jgi:hypothetical protein
MILLRPLENIGHEPFLIKFQEVFAVGYVHTFRTIRESGTGEVRMPLLLLFSLNLILLSLDRRGLG